VCVWKLVFTKQLHPKVLRQLVVLASAGGLEPAPFRAPEVRFDRDGKEDIQKYLVETQTYDEINVDLKKILVHKMDGFLHFSNMEFTWLSRAQSDVAREASKRLHVLRQKNWKPPKVFRSEIRIDEPIISICMSADAQLLVSVSLTSLRVYDLNLQYEATLKYTLDIDIGTLVVQAIMSPCKTWLLLSSFADNKAQAHMYMINLNTESISIIEGDDDGVVFQYESQVARDIPPHRMHYVNRMPLFARFSAPITDPSRTQLMIAYASETIQLWDVQGSHEQLVLLNNMDGGLGLLNGDDYALSPTKKKPKDMALPQVPNGHNSNSSATKAASNMLQGGLNRLGRFSGSVSNTVHPRAKVSVTAGQEGCLLRTRTSYDFDHAKDREHKNPNIEKTGVVTKSRGLDVDKIHNTFQTLSWMSTM